MAEKETGKETEPEVTPEVEPEPTLTSEDQTEELKTQLAIEKTAREKAEALATEKEKGFKRIQRQLSTSKKVTPRTPTSGTAQTIQGVIDVLEAQAAEVGDIPPATQAKISGLRQQLAMAEQQAVYEKQEAITSDFRERGIAKIEAAGFSPDDERFDRYQTMLDRAEDKLGVPGFERAEQRLDHILETAKPKVETKEEKPKPKLPPNDELKASRGSTRVYTRAEIKNMPMKQYEAERDQIEQAYKEDRIKE